MINQIKKILGGAIFNSDIFWIVIIFLVGFGSYFLTLGRLPPGLLNDEVDIGYEAYSISTNLRDQWGNFLPLTYFSGFGGTRLPLIVYWTTPFIKVFGVTTVAVRLAGVAAGMILLFSVWLLVRHFQGRVVAGITSIILLLTPWFWGLTRTTNEAVLALAITVLGLWTLAKSQENSKRLILSAILLGLSGYAYYSSQIFVPLFIAFLLIGWRWLREKDLRIKIFSVVLLFVILAPLYLTSIHGGGSRVRFSQTSFLGNQSLVGELNVHQGDCKDNAPGLWCRLIYNKPSLWFRELVTNYAHHFSLDFLFEDNVFWGILPSGRLFYWLLIPGVGVSLYNLPRRKVKGAWLWFSWLLVAPIADSFTGNGHAMRAFLMVPPVVILAGIGWVILLTKIAFGRWRSLAVAAVVIVFLSETSLFLNDYFWFFPKHNSVYSHYPYRPLMDKLLSLQNSYPDIYLSNHDESVMQYSFYLFYSHYDPRLFQKGTDVVWERQTDGWIWVKQIGKWHFVKSFPNLGKIPLGSLVIGTKSETTPFIKSKKILLTPLHKIDLLSGDTAFVVSKVEKNDSAVQTVVPNSFE